MKTPIILLALARAGCGPTAKEKADAMQLFIESCARPVSASLNVSAYSTDVKMQCHEFKPHQKATK